MNKQTKQLIALGGLVLVAGIVAYFAYFRGGDAPPPKANKATGDTAAKPTETKPGPKTPAKPGEKTPATPGAKPVVQEQDLEIPEPVKFTATEYTWPFPNGGKGFVPDLAREIYAAFDPFLVQNIDVVDPQRREYIESLKQEWVLDGIIETEQSLPIMEDGKPQLGANELDENGKVKRDPKTGKPVKKKVPLYKDGKEVIDEATGQPVMVDDKTPQTKVQMVLEAAFKDKRRYYRESDRLTNTRFTILKIFQKRVYWNENMTDFKVRSGVDLISDTGAPLTIFLADDDRYQENEKTDSKGK